MQEDTLNIQTRKFLKKVGIKSQREIEKRVRTALDAGKIRGDERLNAVMTLEIAALDLKLRIEDDIALEKT